MKLRFAGQTGKRTFSAIRMAGNRFDYAPCYITNSLEKIEADIAKRSASNPDSSVSWVPFVLLDSGDWHPVDDNIRNYCK
jgi:hypothetical protein